MFYHVHLPPPPPHHRKNTVQIIHYNLNYLVLKIIKLFYFFYYRQIEEKDSQNQHKLLGTSQGLLCFTLFITLVTNIQNIRKFGYQDETYYTGLMLNCLCVCLQVVSLFAALCQCVKQFMLYEVPILMATLNRTILKLSAVIVLIQIFLWISK